MTHVAVIAHRKKSLGGGLAELRRALEERGVDKPLWYEVDKSRKARRRALEAADAGADLVFVWGGDGMVQRCIDALAGSGVDIGIVPAGTANLLASNLDVPKDITKAVEAALYGGRRTLDVGNINGERFAVMAGAGFDAVMIKEADGALKNRMGKLAYVWTGARALRRPARRTRVRVDGRSWFEGDASCVLIANVGAIVGGINAFADAKPDDGRLEVGVVTATGVVQWARVLSRMVVGRPERSPLVSTTSGAEIDVRFDTKTVYQLDGGDRPGAKHLTVAVEPAAIRICVPAGERS